MERRKESGEEKMNAVKNEVQQLVKKELEHANKLFPLFNSVHEAYAVMLEETEEAESAKAEVDSNLNTLWDCIKQNSPIGFLKAYNQNIKENAIALAIEAIQIAAMCDKFTLSFISNELGGEDNA